MHPSSPEDFSKIIRHAAAQGIGLRIRGGGSKDFYGSIPQDSVLLNMQGCAGVVAYEPSELVITTQAGTSLQALQDMLAQQGQYLPFDPPHFGHATVGGMLASGLGGPGRVSAGGLRDFVLGVHLIDGRGQALQFGGQVIKNVAGYDVSRLMVGSLGQLGVITQVSLKVLPQPRARLTLALENTSPSQCLKHFSHWALQPLPIHASAWIPTASHSHGCLYVALAGAAAAVTQAQKSLGGDALDTSAAESLWAALREQTHTFFTPPSPEMALWRLSLPGNTALLSPEQAMLWEWHGCQRWAWALPKEGAWLRTWAQEQGGHATLFREPYAKKNHLPVRLHPVDAVLKPIHERIKTTFDPQGVFSSRLHTW